MTREDSSLTSIVGLDSNQDIVCLAVALEELAGRLAYCQEENYCLPSNCLD